MPKTTTGLDPKIYDYLLKSSLREPDVLARLRDETAKHPRANMQVSPDQGQFLSLLVRMTGAKRIIEVGTFTGYSSTSMAMGLPEGGGIIACDVSDEFTQVARRYWKDAGVDHLIDLRLGPAAETLAGLRADGEEGKFDLAFIDADKENYQTYFDHCLALLRHGGVIAVDNVLWSGRVLDPTDETEDTEAIRAFNQRLTTDKRVSISMLSIADGLTLAVKE
ncbi:MAG: class I SAM-dependent methyltransferase [Rhodospirillaceae bacterium]